MKTPVEQVWRNPLKSLIAGVLWRLGMPAVGRWGNRHRLLIITYHGVIDPLRPSDPHLDRNCVDADTFRWQMDYLSRHFRCLSLGEAVSRLKRGAPLPPRAAVVTFDDGFRNTYTRVLPVVRHYGIPVTIFVTTGHVGRGTELLWTERVAWLLVKTTAPLASVEVGDLAVTFPLRSVAGRRFAARQALAVLKATPAETRRRAVDALERQLGGSLEDVSPDPERYGFLDWEEIQEMTGGGIDFGSHSITHPILSQLDDTECWREIAESKRELERHLNRPCLVFSYPNGTRADFGARERQYVATAAYLGAVTQVPDFNDATADRFALQRINIGRGHGRLVFSALVSGLWTRAGAARAGLRRARHRLGTDLAVTVARQPVARGEPGGVDG